MLKVVSALGTHITWSRSIDTGQERDVNSSTTRSAGEEGKVLSTYCGSKLPPQKTRGSGTSREFCLYTQRINPL